MKNPIRETLAAGEPSIGSWLNLASPLAAEVLASAGYSWLAVDAEHSPFDMELIAHTFRAIEARGAIPLARSWDHDPVTTRTASGRRGLGPGVSSHQHAGTGPNGLPVRCVIHRAAVARWAWGAVSRSRRNTARWPTTRCCAFRKSKTSRASRTPRPSHGWKASILAFSAQPTWRCRWAWISGHADHEAALQRFREGCQRADKPCGIPTASGAAARQRIDEGFSFIDLSSDMRFLTAAARQALEEARA